MIIVTRLKLKARRKRVCSRERREEWRNLTWRERDCRRGLHVTFFDRVDSLTQSPKTSHFLLFHSYFLTTSLFWMKKLRVSEFMSCRPISWSIFVERYVTKLGYMLLFFSLTLVEIIYLNLISLLRKTKRKYF